MRRAKFISVPAEEPKYRTGLKVMNPLAATDTRTVDGVSKAQRQVPDPGNADRREARQLRIHIKAALHRDRWWMLAVPPATPMASLVAPGQTLRFPFPPGPEAPRDGNLEGTARRQFVSHDGQNPRPIRAFPTDRKGAGARNARHRIPGSGEAGKATARGRLLLRNRRGPRQDSSFHRGARGRANREARARSSRAILLRSCALSTR